MKLKVLAFVFSLMVLVGCKKDDPLTPKEMIIGKWDIELSELLGSEIPGDGSYLQFENCNSDGCPGFDFKASDGSTGDISYTLNDDATVITITDSSSDGGSWEGEWDILELTETDFRITTNTILGSIKVEMKK